MQACERCGAERQWLHRHHVKPRVEGGTDADGIELLCANCHEDVHGGPFGGAHSRRLTHSPEASRKRRRSLRMQWADPEYREAIMASRAKQVRSNGMTPEQVAERNARVRALRAEGMSQAAIGREVGISQANVSAILRG
jgi:hypothetical protein